uniref:Uncharacterized protein n=1 Tax=Mola mola TaxID=94237 RepID=A0A3Q3WXD3_MOLML
MSASNEQHIENSNACSNPGNPVFSCMSTPAVKQGRTTPWAKPQNLLYRTTSSEYGLLSPTSETSPCAFHPKSHRFSEKLRRSGMYRDNSFNTALDRGRVYDATNLQDSTDSNYELLTSSL